MSNLTAITVQVNTNLNAKTISPALRKAEKSIIAGIKAPFILGEALQTIQENSLYKERGFTTFEQYCLTMYDISRNYAYKMIAAYKVTLIIDGIGIKPLNESQIRPLTNSMLKSEQIKSIWKEVSDTGKLTAITITEKVNQIIGKQTPVKTPEKADKTPEKDEVSPDIVNGKVNTDTVLTPDKEIASLKAQITLLENDLQKAREAQAGKMKLSKLARKMIQEGFKVLSQSIPEEQKEELLQTRLALLG